MALLQTTSKAAAWPVSTENPKPTEFLDVSWIFYVRALRNPKPKIPNPEFQTLTMELGVFWVVMVLMV